MKELKCKNCGAPINPQTLRCEYCGTQYKRDYDNVLRIETYQSPCRTYKTQMVIPKEEIKYLGQETVSEIAIKQLSRNLAEAIAPNMELHTEYDPCYMQQKITARVRIVEPNYRF